MATEQTGNSGRDGARGWEIALHGQQNGFVLGENWCDESSLGRNIWPFLTSRGDPKGTPSTCWNQGSEVTCLEAEIAK